jgi:hypothetical protein
MGVGQFQLFKILCSGELKVDHIPLYEIENSARLDQCKLCAKKDREHSNKDGQISALPTTNFGQKMLRSPSSIKHELG